MKKTFTEIKDVCKNILVKYEFSEEKAERCANIFAANSRDGVYSHGLNRFPVFVEYIQQGLIHTASEPEMVDRNGLMEIWDGHQGAGMYNAAIAMDRAISIAGERGIGCVVLRNNNHWMRGGTYGLMAAEAGCIGICFTNAIASMAPWGGKEPRLGNNPLVISFPYRDKHVLLDIAMSQFSYGKMQEYELENKMLPEFGGYDEDGNPTKDPSVIRKKKSALPIGFWKGSGLALVFDILLTGLGGGLSTAAITKSGKEIGLSQCFICLHPKNFHDELVEEIFQFIKMDVQGHQDTGITYPGERMMATRRRNEQQGIPVDENIWKKVLSL